MPFWPWRRQTIPLSGALKVPNENPRRWWPITKRPSSTTDRPNLRWWCDNHQRYKNKPKQNKYGKEKLYQNPHLKRGWRPRSEEHTSELQSRQYLVCRLLLEKKNHS